MNYLLILSVPLFISVFFGERVSPSGLSRYYYDQVDSGPVNLSTPDVGPLLYTPVLNLSRLVSGFVLVHLRMSRVLEEDDCLPPSTPAREPFTLIVPDRLFYPGSIRRHKSVVPESTVS